MARLLALLASSALLLTQAAANECACEHVKTVTYLVVEMPSPAPVPTSALAIEAAPSPSPFVAAELPVPHHGVNHTATFGPVGAPDIDIDDPLNIVPTTNISLYYGSPAPEEPGSVNVTLSMNTPAVVLEYVHAVTHVDCSDDGLLVSFNNSESFGAAFAEWKAHNDFILVTNHMGDCDAEFERGFFVATDVVEKGENTIFVTAAKDELTNIAGSCEMTFSSMPAATLRKRLTWNPSTSITFSEGLDNNTVLFSDGKYVNIMAEEAWFTSTITFSGYLNYNFWGFKLKDLYFDIDTFFDADVALSADVSAAYTKSFTYSPEELSYSLISVPGLVSLGPGIAFGIGVDLSASAAVGVKAGLGVTLPDGNVHVDLLDQSKTKTSGWKPEYHSYANITEAADVRIDASADLTVELAIELLGGLVDLSSGLTASPGLSNTFKLRGNQGAVIDGVWKNVTVGAEVPKEKPGECGETNSVQLKSDFVFDLTAFATQWWSKKIYSTTVPLWDYCYPF